MQVLKPKTIKDAMLIYPQWKVELKLWIDVFNKKELKFESSIHIKNIWKNKSGWNVDRIPTKKLKKEAQRYGPLDIYVFDIHKNKCRIIVWCNTRSSHLFIEGIYSHAEYDKWCKKHTK